MDNDPIDDITIIVNFKQGHCMHQHTLLQGMNIESVWVSDSHIDYDYTGKRHTCNYVLLEQALIL